MSDGPVVRTDFDYVNTVMDNLKSKVNNSKGIYSENANMKNVSEGNMLYDNMNNIMNSYYSAQNELLDKLSREADAIKQVAKMYQELDERLKNKTEGLDSTRL